MMFDAIKFSGYKSFSVEHESEINDIKYLNLFIGKNNCGKSSVLDVIGAACCEANFLNIRDKIKNLVVGYNINDADLKNTFMRSLNYKYDYVAATKYIGKNFGRIYLLVGMGTTQDLNILTTKKLIVI